VKTSIDLDHCTLTARQKSLIHDLEAAYRTRPAADFEPDPLRQSDRESSLQAWLEGIGFEEAWELSPTLAACQWEIESLQKLQAEFTPETLRLVVKWLAAGCGVNTLLDETRMAAGRVSEIVKSVKAYSFLDQAPVQEVDVQEGLENTLIILRHKTKMGIKIQREYKSDLPHIEAHGGELNQVWTNIMDNAIDAMEGKGELTVRTYIDDGQVIVEIEDTGGGIQSKIQDRIFEPFFTTKPPGKGTGLGLHIAYTIVNNHHGQITVKSKPGKTCFRVALPIQLPH